MTIPIQPVATPSPVQAVNPVITIQPVGTTIPGQGSPQGANPLAAVATGTLVEGFVVNRDAQNNPILRTPLGDLRITSEVFLKTGSEVVFRVDASQASLARIVTVDGISPQEYSAQSARGLTRDTISATGLQTTPAATPTGAQTANRPAASAAPLLQAIVLQPALAGQQPPSPLALALLTAQSGPVPFVTQLTQLKAGTALQLSVLDLKLPPVAVPIKTLPESSTLAQILLPPRLTTRDAAHTLPAATPASVSRPGGQIANPIAVALAQPSAGVAPTLASSTPLLPTLYAAVPSANPGPVSESALPDVTTAATAGASAVVSSTTGTPNPPPNPPPGAHAPVTPSVANVAPNAANPPPALAALPRTGTPAAAQIPAQAELTRPSGPNQVVAQVIGHDADGANILHTPFASLKIYTTQPLPTGTQLLVEAEALPAQPPASSGVALPKALAELAQSASAGKYFPVIGDALAWLKNNHPEVARDAQDSLPNIGRQFVSHVLNYLAGIQSGDAGEILGKRALRLLELNAPDILARLRQQVEQVQTGLREPALSPWSSLPLPLLFAGQLHIAQLYIQRDPPRGEDEKGAQGHGQRFILEVEMSQLGPMQFDGFVRKQQQSKSFDLMVRTDAPLADEVSSGIRDIFTGSMEAARMRGQVIFQHGSQHFVRPMSAAPRKPGDGSNTILA